MVEELTTQIELGNAENVFAITLKKVAVGHILRHLSSIH